MTSRDATYFAIEHAGQIVAGGAGANGARCLVARLTGFTALELAATLPSVPLYLAFGFVAVEHFDLPLVRMRLQIAAV